LVFRAAFYRLYFYAVDSNSVFNFRNLNFMYWLGCRMRHLYTCTCSVIMQDVYYFYH